MKKTFRLAALLLGFLFAISPAANAQETPWFEVETLNSGLGAVPDVIGRATPRATMEALLRYDERRGEPGTQDQIKDTAPAHLLNLNAIPPEEQAETGTMLARQLMTVMQRRAVLNWGQIIDRPDAMDARETSNAATAGMKRRSLLVWEIELDGIPAAIRLDRIKADGEDPVWVISRHTVQKIPALYDAYGPSRFEKWLPDQLRNTAFWGLMWWEVIGLPVLLLLAGLVGWGTSKLLTRVGRHATHRITSAAFRAARLPMIIAAIALLVSIGTQTVFVFSGRLSSVISPLIAAGFVTAILMLIVNVIEVVLDQITGFEEMDLTRKQFDETRSQATRIAAVRRILVLVVFLVGFGIVLSSANLFRTYGFSLLASAGALTLIVGFAARTILSNILSSMQIALNQSARIGDRVVFKGSLCHVERINFTFVQLRVWTGIRLVVPVNEFVSETFENWTLKEPEMQRVISFKLVPTVDIEELRTCFEEVMDDLDPDQLDDRDKAQVRISGQDVFGVEVLFILPCKDPNTSWDLTCIAREKLVKCMNQMAKTKGMPVFPETNIVEAA
ncbi:mechanosensitive ion channel [Sagittula sp. NFXS13]|uniref:mechanosensitive ion channel family protein n=1 Tax=Sagittula sp. NFXS13 TaxID=2819095 RepID=UPI0032DF6887